MVLIKMISAYRENILILSEHVQILEQIFNSEVMRNYLYLSNFPQWVKKKNCTWKKKDISEQYVSTTGWVIFLKNDRCILFSLSFLIFLQKNKNVVYRFPRGSNWSATFCMWEYYSE